MTYDLTLRPRAGALDEQAVVDYFQDSDHWSFADDDDSDLIVYENAFTGVYFQLYYDAAESTFVFSLNFFRPRPFALEADVELSTLVEDFDLAVEDPQELGIEGDTYNDEQFLRGWEHANAQAYQSALADIETTPRTYDGDVLEDIWRWNYNLAHTAEEHGGHYHAPPIGFVEYEGVVHSIHAHDIGQNMLVPCTDLVAVQHGDAITILPWEGFAEAAELTASDKVAEPIDHWAVLGTLARTALRRLEGEEPDALTQLTLADVHALEDVLAATTS